MRHTFPFLFLLLLGFLSIQSCSSTRNISVHVAVPARVFLPEHIQSIGILNRALNREGDDGKILNILEGVMTGEGLNEDRDGSMACISGVETQLNLDQVMHVRVLDSVILSSAGTGVMPRALSWEKVEEFCGENGLDALLVLEVFDTDQGNSNTTQAVNQIINIARTGNVNPVLPSNKTSRVQVKTGWRLYDFQQKVILDEVRMSDFFSVNSGNTLFDLGEFAKRDAIQQSGYMAGRSYPSRFRPGWRRIWRPYFIRKGQEMKKADRLVRVNRVDKAVEIWKSLTDHRKRKIAGRACYNMAIAEEINKDLESALNWAEKAYAEYKVKKAKDYVRALRNRLRSGL